MQYNTTYLPDELKLTHTDIRLPGESNPPVKLCDGELIMKAIPPPKHQQIATKLGVAIDYYGSAKQFGAVLSSPVAGNNTETMVLTGDIIHSEKHLTLCAKFIIY